MRCIECHNGETEPGATTVTFHRDAWTLVVKQIPPDVFENCGEAYVGEDITTQLLAIAAGASEAQVLVRAFVPAA